MKTTNSDTQSVDEFDNIKILAKTVVGGIIILAGAVVVLKVSKIMLSDLRDMGL